VLALLDSRFSRDGEALPARKLQATIYRYFSGMAHYRHKTFVYFVGPFCNGFVGNYFACINIKGNAVTFMKG